MKLHRVCGKWRQIPATAGDKGRQLAAKFHRSLRQKAASSLPQLAACCQAAFLPSELGRGWCLTKLPAFQFQKAATNHVRLNALKLEH